MAGFPFRLTRVFRFYLIKTVNRPKKRLYIKTYGCQMNVYDSEQMALILGQDYELTERAEDADLYLINTCSIRRKSEEKVLSLLGRLKTLKQRTASDASGRWRLRGPAGG